MSGGDKSQKTEKATPKKISDARKQGQVAKSQEVGAWVSLLAISLIVPWTFGRAADSLTALARQLPGLIENPDEGLALAFLAQGLRDSLVVVGPMAALLMVVGVLSGAMQVGLKITPKALKPKFNRLNPLPGLKRMFGAQSAWNTAKELLKLVLLGLLAYRAISAVLPLLTTAGGLTLTTVLRTVADAALSFIRNAAALGLVLAAADYAMQRHQWAKELRMSKKEIQDEHKQAEGDPHLKGAIRSRQLAMSRNRMMSEIATADVVLVNPTHVAVALRYRPERGAPEVVAKGAGAVAAKIRERATEHRVPMVRDVPLARAIHAACDLGDPVPAEFYGAVARVLAFVFALKSRGAAAGLHALPAASAA